MGKKRELQEERLKMVKQRRRNKVLRSIAAAACAAALIAVIVIVTQSRKPAAEEITVGADGGLHIPVLDIKEGLNFYRYGGEEELIVWQDEGGVFRTALDTCQSCYVNGAVRYSLSGSTLRCSSCGNTIQASVLGTYSWEGCMPLSIPEGYRADDGTDIVIPSDVLLYIDEMFTHWDEGDYSISLAGYSAGIE